MAKRLLTPSNLARLLTDAAAEHGARPALKFDQVLITYEELSEQAARVAGLLKQRGVALGDRVGIMLPNVPSFPPVYYGRPGPPGRS